MDNGELDGNEAMETIETEKTGEGGPGGAADKSDLESKPFAVAHPDEVEEISS